MDSGNSGSLQSSSGGDDEFDSRCGGAADSSPLSALLRQPPPPPSVGFGGGSLIYGLQELQTPPPPLSHWCSTTAPLPTGADASPPSSLQGHGAPMAASAAADQQADAAAPAPPPQRGSRKRARASRREPTTVLTTDTSNFRAMVQEFTGIPAPPFAGAAATARTTRFDHHLLFPLRTATAAAAAAGGTASAAALPQYLLRPFAQKVQLHASSSATPYPPSFTSPSTSSPAPANISIIPPASTTPPGTSTTALASSGDSYHHQLAAASTSALLGMQRAHSSSSSSSNYHSFRQSSSLGAGSKYAAHPALDHGIAPPSSATRLQDPADFMGLTHAHLHLRNGGDELSGRVGGASVTGAGGCKATYSSSTRPLLECSRRNPSADVSTATTTTTVPVTAAAVGMRSQAGVVDSWVCTSD